MDASFGSFEELHHSLLDGYGPLLSDAVLWRSLGFKTWAGFDKAMRNGKIEVRVFTMPGRRGRYALTLDVAKWLWNLRSTGLMPHSDNSKSDNLL